MSDNQSDMTTTDADKPTEELKTIDVPGIDLDRLKRLHKFDPANLVEAMTLAEMLAQLGGDMIPKEIVGNAAAIITRIMQGNEIGLPAMTSLHAIAMINGRPCVHGDVAMSLYLMHPNYLRHTEEFVDGPGGLTATVVVQCRNGNTFTGTFSAHDADTAQLTNKDNYKKYPRDMYMWRARHRALGPACPGALKNVGVAQLAKDDMTIEVVERSEPAKAALPPVTRTARLKQKVAPKSAEKPAKTKESTIKPTVEATDEFLARGETTEPVSDSVKLAEVLSAIHGATNADALAVAADLGNELNAMDKTAARAAYVEKRKALES